MKDNRIEKKDLLITQLIEEKKQLKKELDTIKENRRCKDDLIDDLLALLDAQRWAMTSHAYLSETLPDEAHRADCHFKLAKDNILKASKVVLDV